MAIYSCSVKVHSRSKGESATGGAAYRLGLCIENEMTGQKHDYSNRKDIEAAFTVLPENAPEGWDDPAKLWNEAEKAEKRKNSCVSREVLVALPAEMTAAEREALTRDIAGQLVSRYGVAVSAGIHEPEDGGKNSHAHLLMSTRRLGPDGFGEKTRELDDIAKPKDAKGQLTGEPSRGVAEVLAIREFVADLTNQHLERGGYAERVDHRTLEAQREAAMEKNLFGTAAALDRAPTKHEGRNPEIRERVVQENEQTRQNNATRAAASLQSMEVLVEKAREQGRLMEASSDARPANKPEPEAEEAREKQAARWLRELVEVRERRDRLEAEQREATKRADELKAMADAMSQREREHGQAAGKAEERARDSHWSAKRKRGRVEDWEAKHPIRTAIGWRSLEVNKWIGDAARCDAAEKEGLEKLKQEQRAEKRAAEQRQELRQAEAVKRDEAQQLAAGLKSACVDVEATFKRHRFESMTPEQQAKERDRQVAAAAGVHPAAMQQEADRRAREASRGQQRPEQGRKPDYGMEQ